MKYLVIFAIIATFAWTIDGAAIDTDEVQIQTDEIKEAPVVPVEDINEDCHQPKVTGRCFALFQRYAFNVDNRACEEFIYGGCGGNTNNFETKEECERKCNAKTSEEPSPTAIEPKGEKSNDESEKAVL